MEPTRPAPHVAEIADRHRRYFVFSMLFVALVHAAEAGEELLDGRAARVAGVLALVGVIGIFYFIGRVALWKLRNLSSDLRELYFDEDGFVADALARAHTVSWAVTFVFMALAARLDNLLAGLTGFALVYIAVAIMTATFGICFLWLARDPGASDPEVPRA